MELSVGIGVSMEKKGECGRMGLHGGRGANAAGSG